MRLTRLVIMRRRLIRALALFLAPALAPTAAAAVELVPHEAVYRLTLLETSHKGAIVHSQGALGVRVKRHCNAWQSQNELLFTIELDSGKKIRIHNMIRLRETVAGRRVEFTGWTDSDKSGRIDTRGRATIPDSENPGEVVYQKPKKDQHKLAIGVGLPTEALVKTLDQLIAGETPAPVHYFDPYAKYTEMRLLGGAPTILKTPPQGSPELVEGKSWRLRVTPVYESQTFNEMGAHTILQIHANGIASHMVIDLGTIKLAASLAKVQTIEATGCAPVAPVVSDKRTPLREIPQEGISIEQIPSASALADNEDPPVDDF